MPYKDKEKQRRYYREYYHNNKNGIQEKVYEAGQKIRLEALQHYSSAHPRCAHCNEDDIDVLCIDHINDDGAECRRRHGMGSHLFRWLKSANYPKGFQVLCYNCNARKEAKHRLLQRGGDSSLNNNKNTVGGTE